MYVYYGLEYNGEIVGVINLPKESKYYFFTLKDKTGEGLRRKRGPLFLSESEFGTYLAFGVPLLKEIKRNHLEHARVILIELQIPNE